MKIPILCVGDRLKLKKKHPCGGDVFIILRVGSDIRLRCETCGHDLTMERIKLEKAIKQQLPKESEGQKIELQ